MKLRYIFTALAAAALAFVGCQEEERFLDEVKVSESIVAIPIKGGEAKLTINATADWSFVETKLWPEEVTKDKDGNETRKPSWVTVDVTSGGAGETEVTISAEEASANRELNLYVACAGVQQTVKVVQMAERVPAALATCKQVLDDHAAGVAVGKTYKVKGTVTDITNYDKYGCFYVNDGTGQVYVYGSMNSDQFDPSVGDIITFEGPWTSYGNFDDVTILELEKSLLKVEKISPDGPVSANGGKLSVTLTIKAKEHEVVIPEDVDWITYDEKKDVMVLGETTYIYDFTLSPNAGTPRQAAVTFLANVDGVDYSAVLDVEQDGSIAEMSINEAVTSGELAIVLGKVIYTHSKGLLITDGKNVLYGYLGSQPEVAVNDIVKLTGKVTKYNGGRSMNKPTVEKAEGTVGSYSAPTAIALDAAKFAEYTSSSADFATPYVTITGVAETDSYNNLIVKLVDGETTYSVKSYYGTESYADWNGKEVRVFGYAYNAYADSKQVNLIAETVMDAAAEVPATVTLTNAEIVAAMTSTETSYVEFTIESASGLWTVNAQQLQGNTYLQLRGRKGSYIKTPAFEKDIKSVTLHFSSAKDVYADNIYCAFPATWVAPQEDAAYPEDGNVGRAVTDGSYSVTIPVNAGNKQVCVSLIRKSSYYLDHIDVAF